MRTSVAVLPDGRVRHTTRLSKGALVFFSSVEHIEFLTDGHHFSMPGLQRQLPTWLARPARDHGAVQADGQGARYHLTLLGVPVVQITAIVATAGGDGVALVQHFGPPDAPFAEARVTLQRSSPS